MYVTCRQNLDANFLHHEDHTYCVKEDQQHETSSFDSFLDGICCETIGFDYCNDIEDHHVDGFDFYEFDTENGYQHSGLDDLSSCGNNLNDTATLLMNENEELKCGSIGRQFDNGNISEGFESWDSLKFFNDSDISLDLIEPTLGTSDNIIVENYSRNLDTKLNNLEIGNASFSTIANTSNSFEEDNFYSNSEGLIGQNVMFQCISPSMGPSSKLYNFENSTVPLGFSAEYYDDSLMPSLIQSKLNLEVQAKSNFRCLAQNKNNIKNNALTTNIDHSLKTVANRFLSDCENSTGEFKWNKNNNFQDIHRSITDRDVNRLTQVSFNYPENLGSDFMYNNSGIDTEFNESDDINGDNISSVTIQKESETYLPPSWSSLISYDVEVKDEKMMRQKLYASVSNELEEENSFYSSVFSQCNENNDIMYSSFESENQTVPNTELYLNTHPNVVEWELLQTNGVHPHHINEINDTLSGDTSVYDGEHNSKDQFSSYNNFAIPLSSPLAIAGTRMEQQQSHFLKNHLNKQAFNTSLDEANHSNIIVIFESKEINNVQEPCGILDATVQDCHKSYLQENNSVCNFFTLESTMGQIQSKNVQNQLDNGDNSNFYSRHTVDSGLSQNNYTKSPNRISRYKTNCTHLELLSKDFKGKVRSSFINRAGIGFGSGRNASFQNNRNSKPLPCNLDNLPVFNDNEMVSCVLGNQYNGRSKSSTEDKSSLGNHTLIFNNVDNGRSHTLPVFDREESTKTLNIKKNISRNKTSVVSSNLPSMSTSIGTGSNNDVPQEPFVEQYKTSSKISTKSNMLKTDLCMDKISKKLITCENTKTKEKSAARNKSYVSKTDRRPGTKRCKDNQKEIAISELNSAKEKRITCLDTNHLLKNQHSNVTVGMENLFVSFKIRDIWHKNIKAVKSCFKKEPEKSEKEKQRDWQDSVRLVRNNKLRRLNCEKR